MEDHSKNLLPMMCFVTAGYKELLDCHGTTVQLIKNIANEAKNCVIVT